MDFFNATPMGGYEKESRERELYKNTSRVCAPKNKRTYQSDKRFANVKGDKKKEKKKRRIIGEYRY